MNRMTLIVLGVEAVLAGVAIAVGWWIGTPILEDARIDAGSGALALAATLPLVAFVVWSMRSESSLFTGLRSVVRDAVAGLFASCSALEIILISIMAGVGEELFFRGLLQGSLARIVNPWIALILISILFGVLHWVSAGYALFAGLIGLYLGALLLLTGNILVPTVVHALFDFAALLVISRMTTAPATEAAPSLIQKGVEPHVDAEVRR